MTAVPKAGMLPFVGAATGRIGASALPWLASWRRPARRALALGLVLAAWHVATTWRLDLYVRFQNIPTPARVLEEAVALFGSASFYVHILASLERIWLGFAIATALGVGLGLIIGWFRFAEDTLFPPIELLRPIPAVAWVPLSIMLWPTERSSIVFITCLGAFFPIVLNTIHGVEGIDRQLVRAATSLGAGRAAIFREVVIPGALPSIVTGLSVGMGVSWICLISAEMISGQFGVGYFTWVAYGIVKYSQIVVGMLVIGVLGMLSSAFIRWAGTRCMPWLPRRVKDEA
jgi:NitT/TauT family transport system permease protein